MADVLGGAPALVKAVLGAVGVEGAAVRSDAGDETLLLRDVQAASPLIPHLVPQRPGRAYLAVIELRVVRVLVAADRLPDRGLRAVRKGPAVAGCALLDDLAHPLAA